MKLLLKYLGKFAKTPALKWLLVCIVASVFIWTMGPGIAIYGDTPLANVLLRVAIILLIFVVWLLVFYRQKLKEHLASAQPAKTMYNDENQIDRHEKKQIKSDFKKLKNFLLKHKREQRQEKRTLYDLPWYLVMGAQGSGKTSFLREAELHLAYQSYNHVGYRPSKFQWVLAEEAVFLDLPAEFCEQKTAQQRFNWQAFLKYLKRMRARRPINGLILMVNIRDLLENKLDDWQESMRIQLHELQQKLKMKIPVYLVLSFADTIGGFPEFTLRFTDQERNQVLGLTFEANEVSSLDQFPFQYDELIASLNVRLRRDLDQEWIATKSSEMLYFPMQLAALRERLLSLSKSLFAERRYFNASTWRGLYFMSNGILGTSRYDVILDESVFHVTELPKNLKNRRYFSEGLLKQVIVKEAELVGVQPFYEYQFNLKQSAKKIALIGATAGLSIMWTISFMQYQDYNETVMAGLANLNNGPVSVSSDHSLNALYGKLDTLGTLYHAGLDGSGSFWLHLGLWNRGSSFAAVTNLYQQALVANFLPYVLSTLQSGLQTAVQNSQNNVNSMNAIQSLYDLLASYLMFHQQDHLEKTAIENTLAGSFASNFAGNTSLQTWLGTRLNDLLVLGFPAQSLNQGLIDQARLALSNSPVYIQAYLLLKLSAVGQNQENFVLGKEVDFASSNEFNGLSTAVVPQLFTAQGYSTTYQNQAENSLDQITKRAWILGNNYPSYSRGDLDKYQSDMDKLYWSDYITAWNTALSALSVAPFTSLQQAIGTLGDLSSNSGPLVGLINLVQKNSNFGSGNPVTAYYQPLTGASLQPILASISAVQQYLASINSSSNPGLAAYNAAVAIFAGQADKSLTTLASEAATAPAPLSAWLNQILANSYAVIFSTANQYLSTQWQSQVAVVYQQAIAGRFPFAQSQSEVNLQDFSNFFKPGGVEDSFVKKYLSPFITADSFGNVAWNNVNNIPFSNSSAIASEVSHSAMIRSAFFGSSSGSLNFTVSPMRANNSASAILSYDGKNVTLDDDSGAGVAMIWPAQTTDGTVTVTFHRLFAPDDVKTYTGPWGIFRLVDSSTVVRSKYGSQVQVTMTGNGNSVSFGLSANSGQNPFDLKLLRSYACPNGF